MCRGPDYIIKAKTIVISIRNETEEKYLRLFRIIKKAKTIVISIRNEPERKNILEIMSASANRDLERCLKSLNRQIVKEAYIV